MDIEGAADCAHTGAGSDRGFDQFKKFEGTGAGSDQGFDRFQSIELESANSARWKTALEQHPALRWCKRHRGILSVLLIAGLAGRCRLPV